MQDVEVVTPSVDYLFNCDIDKKLNRGCKSGFVYNSLEFIQNNYFVGKKCWDSLESLDDKCPSEE